jgi:hypothetical protein
MRLLRTAHLNCPVVFCIGHDNVPQPVKGYSRGIIELPDGVSPFSKCVAHSAWVAQLEWSFEDNPLKADFNRGTSIGFTPHFALYPGIRSAGISFN